MRRTVITRLQRFLLLLVIVCTAGVYHSVKTAHGSGWSWWGWVVLFVGLVLTEAVLRSRTETRTEAYERRIAARRLRYLRNEARKAQDDRDAWLREH